MEKNKDKIILDLCGGTGSWSRPYKEAGYDVKVLTLLRHDIGLAKILYNGYLSLDINESPYVDEIKVKDIYGILAAPPCTMFSIVRTTPKIPRSFEQGMKTVQDCLKIIWGVQFDHKLAFWALENPFGYLRRFLGKPAYQFDPTEFGGGHNKKTDLWGQFNEPKKTQEKQKTFSLAMKHESSMKIPDDYVRDPNMRKDAIARSITPAGFAKAFFEANQ